MLAALSDYANFFVSTLEPACGMHFGNALASLLTNAGTPGQVTATLKHKLDAVFGSSFNTNGLGGVLTCGTTGLKAGLSHAPISAVITGRCAGCRAVIRLRAPGNEGPSVHAWQHGRMPATRHGAVHIACKRRRNIAVALRVRPCGR